MLGLPDDVLTFDLLAPPPVPGRCTVPEDDVRSADLKPKGGGLSRGKADVEGCFVSPTLSAIGGDDGSSISPSAQSSSSLDVASSGISSPSTPQDSGAAQTAPAALDPAMADATITGVFDSSPPAASLRCVDDWDCLSADWCVECDGDTPSGISLETDALGLKGSWNMVRLELVVPCAQAGASGCRDAESGLSLDPSETRDPSFTLRNCDGRLGRVLRGKACFGDRVSVCGEGGVRILPSIDPWGETEPKGFGRTNGSPEALSVGMRTDRPGCERGLKAESVEPSEPEWLVAKLPVCVKASWWNIELATDVVGTVVSDEEAVEAANWPGAGAGASTGGPFARVGSTIPDMSSRFMSRVNSGSPISCIGEIAPSGMKLKSFRDIVKRSSRPKDS